MKKYYISVIVFNLLLITAIYFTLSKAVLGFIEVKNLIKYGVSANGKVIAHIETTCSGGGTCFYPKVSFKTNNNSEYIFKNRYDYRGPVMYPVGSGVKVLYDPSNPFHALIDSYEGEELVNNALLDFFSPVLLIIFLVIINSLKIIQWNKKKITIKTSRKNVRKIK